MKHNLLYFLLFFLTISCSPKKQRPQIAAPNAANAILYQLNVRDFTTEGTFKAMLARLPEIKSLGVNTVILAPIHPIGQKNRTGTLGSVYATTNFKGIHPDLGTAIDFQNLIDSCHTLGLHVLLEWEATQVAADHPWLTSQKAWIKRDSSYFPMNPSAGVAKLQLTDSALRQELTQNMAYWVDTFAIDGYFATSAAEFPASWWSKTIQTLKAHRAVLLVANAAEPALAQAGFDLLADDQLYKQLNTLFQPASTSNPQLSSMKTLTGHFHSLSKLAGPAADSAPSPLFQERKSAMLAFLFSAISPGAPFIVAGEEVGHKQTRSYSDKNQILWASNPDIRSYYSELLKIRAQTSSLNEADFRQDSLSHSKILLIRRGKGLNTVYSLINTSDSLANVQIPLELQGKRFTDLYTGRSVLLEKELLMLEYSFYLLKEAAAS